MIPKTIHYCWFGGKPLPLLARKCMASWERMCPDYQIVRWDESNFDPACHPFCQAAFEAGAWAFVSDYARLKVVHDHGGIYLDVDVELIKPLDSLLDTRCYIGVSQIGMMCNTGLGFGAEKRSLAVARMMRKYDELTFDQDHLQELACPRWNHEVISEMGYSLSEEIVDMGEVVVYPCRYFDPFTPGGDTDNLLCSDTVSISRYGNSWGGPISKIKNNIQRLLGYKVVNNIRRVLNDSKLKQHKDK